MKTLVSLLCLILLTGCSSITVSTDYDADVDFDDFKTYTWLPAPANKQDDPRIKNDLLESRIHQAVDNQLAALGFRKLDDGDVDCYVNYYISLEKELDVVTIGDYYGYDPYWRHRRGMGPTTIVQEVDVGTLMIDILESKKKGLIWRGTAQALVDTSSTPEQRTKKINTAVSKIFSNFPPE